MTRVLLVLMMGALSAFGGEPFDPVSAFSSALAPILTSGERGKIQTTWRGFFARGDTQAGLQKSDTEPTAQGLYLDVEVRDAEEALELSDVTVQEGGITCRKVRTPAPKGDPQSLLIVFRYGPDAEREAIAAIEACITKIIATSKATPR